MPARPPVVYRGSHCLKREHCLVVISVCERLISAPSPPPPPPLLSGLPPLKLVMVMEVQPGRCALRYGQWCARCSRHHAEWPIQRRILFSPRAFGAAYRENVSPRLRRLAARAASDRTRRSSARASPVQHLLTRVLAIRRRDAVAGVVHSLFQARPRLSSPAATTST